MSCSVTFHLKFFNLTLEINYPFFQEEYELHNRIWSDQESLIVKLEKEKLDDELKGLTLESRKHEEETQLIKRKLSDCEGDIALCRQKITQLMESLERSEMIAREKKEVEESEKLLMEQMRMSIREKTREIENQVIIRFT